MLISCLVASCCIAPFLSGTPHRELSPLLIAVRQQNVVSVTLSHATIERSLYDALSAVSKQANVTFLVETGGGKPTLAGSKPALSGEQNMPLDESVEQIAAAYGYRAEQRRGIFLLRKRFLRESDLPELSLEEYQDCLTDISRVLQPFDPGMDSNSNSVMKQKFFRDFLFSLSPDQLEKLGVHRALLNEPAAAMEESKGVTTEERRLRDTFESVRGVQSVGGRPMERLLSMADLNPGQQATIRRMGLATYTGAPVSANRNALIHVKDLLRSDADFRWGNASGYCVLGYEPLRPIMPTDDSNFIPLSAALSATALPEAKAVASEGIATVTPEATSPRVAVSSGPVMPLQEVAELLTRRSSGAKTIVVDKTLALKRVALIQGDRESPAEAVAEGLASLYDLRLVKEKEGAQLRLSRHSPKLVNQVTELQAALWSCLPDTVTRTLQKQLTNGEDSEAKIAEEKATSRNGPPRPPGIAAVTPELPAPHRLKQFAEKLQSAAARDLGTGLEPNIVASPERRIHLSRLNPEFRNTFAVVLMARYLDSVADLLTQVPPPSVTNIEQAKIVGHISPIQGTPFLDCSLYIPFPEGGGTQIVKNGVRAESLLRGGNRQTSPEGFLRPTCSESRLG